MAKDDPLMTVAEVAEALGVTPSTVRAYKARGQMPEPDKKYGATPLWLESTIQRWRPEASR